MLSSELKVDRGCLQDSSLFSSPKPIPALRFNMSTPGQNLSSNIIQIGTLELKIKVLYPSIPSTPVGASELEEFNSKSDKQIESKVPAA
ncbi:hypothetical protein CEXT_511981 [Caerostris extrusa]|uniref:Uncharacterized protein n=1 Tax=Caerostris extrusa TaxID=172846 RepID=A0AAV4XMR8_CAEEX|nr:hypothetical protein CEXT_511981 [Caerostris extrusa]